ncbi:MAG TPA: LacI family DNA-binding transcriptional regulator [Sphingomonas sp.]|nr:LacI family DNA-binding transcriptional regulator [Sphingomonas sp.]
MRSMSKRSVTIFDVAREASVSVKTVSRVLNDEPRVRTDTRTTVLAAVKRLKYQRNAYARGLRADNTNIYGLIYADASGGYHSDVLAGVLTKCKAEGCHLIVELIEGQNQVQQMEKFVAQVRLDGAVVMAPLCDDTRLLAILAEYNIPVVRISPRQGYSGELTVAIDDEQAAIDIVDHLVALGHRRIGFVQGTPDMAASEQRLAGYRKALHRHDIAEDASLIAPGHFDLASGEVAGAALLALPEPPSAIVAANDETAAGVLAAAYQYGLVVPQDLSICGFDDSMVARTVSPPLTTVRQPSRDVGSEAIAILRQYRRDMAGGHPVASIRKIMQHQVIVRGSTSGPRLPNSGTRS